MKKLLLIIPVITFLSGCAASGIKITGKAEPDDVYPMFGRVASMDFYSPVKINDSLNLKWEFETNGSFPGSSITAFKEYIFINDLSGRIYCFNSNTGKLTGQLKHKGPVYTTPVINWYNVMYVESIPDEDISYLRAYNFIEGKQTAEREIKGRVKTEILKIENDIYFVTEKGLLYKFSRVGDQYWVKDTRGEIQTNPVSDGKFIYLFNTSGELLKLGIEDGNTAARIMTEFNISSGLTLRNDNIFMGTKEGLLYCINKNNGEVKWSYSSGSKITASPVLHNDIIYTVNLSGEVFAVNADTGEEIWTIKTGGLLNATPLLTNNFLVVPDMANRILFIDPRDGSEKKSLELPNRAKLSPVISNNLLIIGFDRGVLRAYEII